jgi:hypothetical protein
MITLVRDAPRFPAVALLPTIVTQTPAEGVRELSGLAFFLGSWRARDAIASFRGGFTYESL